MGMSTNHRSRESCAAWRGLASQLRAYAGIGNAAAKKLKHRTMWHESSEVRVRFKLREALSSKRKGEWMSITGHDVANPAEGT